MRDPCSNCEKRPTQLEKLDAIVEKAKAYSIVLITAVIVIGILIVFACSVFTKEVPGLSEMNQFVSIVLGVVATIVSIVSMLISFYGLEKTEESERRQNVVLQEIIEIEKDTRRSTKAIENSMQTTLTNPNSVSRSKQNTDENQNIDVDVDELY